MLEILLVTVVLIGASLVLGAALLALLGAPGRGGLDLLAGPLGFAALVVLAPFLVRLPGRATTAAILLALLLIAAAIVWWRRRGGADVGRPVAGSARSRTPGPDGAPERDTGQAAQADTPGPELAAESDTGRALSRDALVASAAAILTIALASLPFAFAAHLGTLGEGIYTNDHAAQLYWADWLQHGFGPEPSAVRFGYPIGPQALTAVLAEASGADLVAAFNGLLLAIPALTALAALVALRELPAGRRIAVAALCGLPYLGASFLAQSAFKETAMALFLLAFTVAIAALSGLARTRADAPPRRLVAGVVLILSAASVFTFSLPGLAWFAIALPLWLALEARFGRSPVDLAAVRAALSRHRLLVGAAAAIVVAVVVVGIGPVSSFIDKIGDVQESAGRLSSPIFPGEAFGIWPEGDFRIARGEVSGALLAAGIGALAVAFGAWTLIRRRQLAILAAVLSGGLVYVGARLFAQIHVEAKALAVIAPLLLLVALRPLLAPGEPRSRIPRYLAGGLLALAALLSTLLALRAAPVGFEERGAALERLAERADGETLVFLGVDRFSGYWLRETLVRAPAGYVPQEIAARPEKIWQQGDAVDFDTVEPGKLDKFRYAITTAAAFGSTPPANFERVAEDGGYVLWRRGGATPRARVLDEGPWPGAIFDCEQAKAPRRLKRGGAAVTIAEPLVLAFGDWRGPRVATAAGGQEGGFRAGEGPIVGELDGLEPGRSYAISLQYHSQVPLTVLYGDQVVAELPPTLAGMYLDGAGRGAFWPAGEVEAEADAGFELRPQAPGGLADAVGAERRVWLGNLAATPLSAPGELSLREACGAYVDHFNLDDRGRGKG